MTFLRGLSGRWGLAAVACAALAAVAAALLAAGLADGEEPRLPDGAIPAPAVLDDPRDYLGREITVSGRVDLLADGALTLGDEDLIVIARGPGAERLQASGVEVEDIVYARGELRMLSAEGVTDLLPRTSLLPSAFQGFERQPVLLADEVVPAA